MIYLDHNATTPLDPAVLEAMLPHLTSIHGNPASAHAAGRQARRALEDAREQVASLLGAFPDEVVFTSGATEANNLAIFGLSGPPGHLIASPLEHPSILEPLRQLANAGFALDWLPVDQGGHLFPGSLPLDDDTRLVCAMLVNHEVGTIQPVDDLVDWIARSGLPIRVHCDATQAIGKVPVHFHGLGVTSLSLSAHKCHGPKGVGALLLNRCTPLTPRTFGGQQQQARRPGTEPVALAVGLARALELACASREDRLAHVHRLSQHLLDHLQRHASPVLVNGLPAQVPHTLNLSFPGLQAESLLMALDLAGIACSAGSACASGSLQPSAVLRAMGLDEARLRSALRFSLAHTLTMEQLEEAGSRISGVVNRLRRSTPVEVAFTR